ncbi:uncharacterized protein LOC126847458 isoform X2 [Adelges cooleyi]|uniref:uncharacterized protein LOC126847458 isoform X2 n=1 Tax=Adelges cooleyi TaxID=133065 RepID=UPI00217F6E82|nr:uncharacterized protein LOC126847458 isoform X2 [Adelges cooleyi]
MNLSRFLLSFVFLHVSTNHLNYKREVLITNVHIELAYNMNNFTVGNKIIAKYYAYLYISQEAIEIQKALQSIITTELGIGVPAVPDQIFEELVLTQLGKERRRFTGKALKDLMSHLLTNVDNLTALVEVRRINPTVALNRRMVRSSNSSKPEGSLLWMCRLLGLFTSTKFPISFIKNINTGHKKTCFLEDEITANKIYREINGVWWQVNVNNIEDKLQLLEKQL